MSRQAVFLDRDGTLIEHYDYLTKREQVRLLPRASAALRLLQKRGFLLVVITNQSAVARGKLTEETLREIHDYLRRLLADEGVYLDGIYYCPFHPDAVIEKYRQDSPLRKPLPGMLELASEELDIDLAASWVIGDDDRDIQAGKAAACRTILMEARGSTLVRRGQAKPDFRAVNLQEAANLIIRHSENKTPSAPPAEEGISGEPGEPAGFASAPEADESSPVEAKPEEIPPAPESAVSVAEPLAATASGREVPREDVLATGTPLPEIETALRDLEVRKQEIARRKKQKMTKPLDPLASKAPEADTTDDLDASRDTHALLVRMLRELKSLNRHQSAGGDFSIAKLLAGLVQMGVVVCLVLAFGSWIGEAPNMQTVQTLLMVAMVLQTLTLTLWMAGK